MGELPAALLREGNTIAHRPVCVLSGRDRKRDAVRESTAVIESGLQLER
jgi:hypothetical protein